MANPMRRSRVFMNEVRPKERIERDLLERFERIAGVRPLDGTNLAWIYDRPKRLNEFYYGDGDGTYSWLFNPPAERLTGE